jgi:hypothetical protein
MRHTLMRRTIVVLGVFGSLNAQAEVEGSIAAVTRKIMVESVSTSKAVPVAGELRWSRVSYGVTGPMARVRLADRRVQLASSLPVASGPESILQLGHTWSGPSMGELSTAFEFGLATHLYFSSNTSAVPSARVGGGFWGLVVRRGEFGVHAEASLLALPIGDQGVWGRLKDANSIRVRAFYEPTSCEGLWKVFAEFFHVHQTFSTTRIPNFTTVFVSDLSVALGVSRRF